MTEEKNRNQQEQQTAAHEADQETSATNKADEAATQNDDEKKFTQKDLDRILSERLNRSKQNQATAEELEKQKAENEEKETALLKRENRLLCREYLSEKNYPPELLDIINTDDVESFKNKAASLHRLYRPAAQHKSNEPPLKAAGTGFEKTKHAPRNHPYHRYD